MSKVGYIKLHRKCLDHWLYNSEPFDKWHAWEDLLLNANYDTGKTIYKGEFQVIKPGQIMVSDNYLAKRWHWSRGKVRRYIDILEIDGMLKQKRTPNGTSLTIENWGFYQGRSTSRSTSNGTTDGTTDGTQKKNIKNNKNSTSHGVAPSVVPPARAERKVGEVIVDDDGFKYIVKTDGTIDRYRGSK